MFCDTLPARGHVTTWLRAVFAACFLMVPIAVAAQSDIQNSPVGRWLAEDVDGGGVIDRLQTILEIAEDGAVSGTGGCNRMIGKATIAGNALTFGTIASTQMACTPAAMAQERKFFDALEKVRSWRVDIQRRKLTLLDAQGKPLVVFARM